VAQQREVDDSLDLHVLARGLLIALSLPNPSGLTDLIERV